MSVLNVGSFLKLKHGLSAVMLQRLPLYKDLDKDYVAVLHSLVVWPQHTPSCLTLRNRVAVDHFHQVGIKVDLSI